MRSESLFTECKNCGKGVAKAATVCPHCSTKRSTVTGGKVAIVVVGALIVVLFANQNPTASLTPRPQPGRAVETEGPLLELLSWRCDKAHGFVHVKGEVKNISGRKLEHVVAVGSFRTASGELVKSEDALIDYSPILPAQTSPFSAGGTDNPEISRCEVAFKYLMGGTIAVADAKPK